MVWDMTTPRTAAATAAAKRNSEERRAQMLRERGWSVIPPETIYVLGNQNTAEELKELIIGYSKGNV